LSRSEARGRLFSALAETLWYLSGSNDVEFIAHYLEYYRSLGENGVVWGGYGHRLFEFDGFDQVQYVIDKLQGNPSSRQAVIQLFDHADVASHHEDVPCTCTIQFLVRSGGLCAITYMRSNDVHLGLPHDVFAFTVLQELIARSIGVQVGPYVHVVGSFHLYDKDVDAARAFLEEGWQSTTLMPSMPDGDPWAAVRRLIEVERRIRTGALDPMVAELDEDPYWADLGRLLMIFALWRWKRLSDLAHVEKELHNDVYRLYIADKLTAR
jgi:thymidylate synthase